jgi:hypothetical protein
MSKIVKAIDVEVNKRLTEYLVTFIKYNYENGPQFPEGGQRPSDEDIEGHISSYITMNPFSLEEKVVEKKRMGRPKKHEKETVVAAEEEMFGNLIGNVSELKLEYPNNIPPVVGDDDKEKPGKAPKAKKEKVVKEKVVKEKKEKVVKEKVVKEKKEKVPKEKKEKVVKAKAVKNEEEEEENPYAINDDGYEGEGAKKKVVKEKKEKVVKEKKEKVVKEGEGEVKKRGRPKKGEEKAKSDTEDEEEVNQLGIQLTELCSVAVVPTIKADVPSQSSKEAAIQSGQGVDDEVAFEEYEDFEEEVAVSSPKTEAQDHIVKFTDKNTGKDYFIDKQMLVENEDAAEGENWYAVKDASSRAVVGRSNLRQMELFEEEDDADDEDDDEEEEEEEEEDD